MGLDMYITAERYMSKFVDPKDETKIQKINELFGIKNSADNYRVQSVVFNVAYWREANYIHAWFVQNVQGDIDECQKSYVTVEQLQTLLDVCKEVIADPKKAKTLLQTQGGFFFGSTEYDDGYFEDIQDTITQLERILSDPALEKMDLYYRASW